MSFDLIPVNKKLDSFHMNGLLWGWMLDQGVGLVIGYGPATEPASFYYTYDRKGRCPMYNDGFRVSAEDSRAMAKAALGLVNVKRWINREWSLMTPEERAEKERGNEMRRGLYRTETDEYSLEKIEEFALWASESRGFRVF